MIKNICLSILVFCVIFLSIELIFYKKRHNFYKEQYEYVITLWHACEMDSSFNDAFDKYLERMENE